MDVLSVYNITHKKMKFSIINILIAYFYIIINFISYCLLPYENKTTVLFYISAITLSVFFAWYAQRCDGWLRKTSFWASFFVLFFVLGFRNASGIDDPSYVNTFARISQTSWTKIFTISEFEPGYIILNKLVSLFTNEYIVFQAICSFIPMFAFYKAFEKYQNIISLPSAVLLLISSLYFQMLAVSLVRMFIAIGFVFYATVWLTEKKPYKYICFVVLAGLFHYSALITLALVVLANRNIDIKRHWKKFFITALILAPFIFIVIANEIAPILGNRHSQYTYVRGVNLSIYKINEIPIAFFALLLQKHIPHKYRNVYAVYIFFVFLSIAILFFGNINSMGRLVFYTNLGLLIVFPMALRYHKFANVKFVVAIGIISYSYIYILYTQWFLIRHSDYLFPYHNIFFTI